jgi:hypothetical protein
MASLIERRINELQNLVQELIDTAGQASPQGAGTLSKSVIKGKSIISSMIDVDTLHSVQAKTGDLTVTGNITMSTDDKAIRAGKTVYNDTSNAGYWLGVHAAVGYFRIGNAVQQLLWDGTNLTISGGITATSGVIGGWTIGAADIHAGSGSTYTQVSSAGGSTPAFSAGSATVTAAPFMVTQSGAITAISGSIGGWTIDSTSGFILGSGATTRGIAVGSTTFYAGSATPSSAPFSVTSAGALTATSATIIGTITTGNITATGGTIGGVTINATSLSSTGWTLTNAGVMTSTSGTIGGLTISSTALTVPSGVKLKFGIGALDYLNDNLLHFELSSSLIGKIEFKNGSEVTYTDLQVKASSTVGQMSLRTRGTTNRSGIITLNGGNTNATTNVSIAAIDSTPATRSGLDLNAAGTLSLATYNTSGVAQGSLNLSLGDQSLKLPDAGGAYSFQIQDSAGEIQFGVSSNGALIYPDADTTAAGGYNGRMPIFVNGVQKYLHYFNA